MDAYTLGLIAGAILQPSTIIAFILTIFLKKRRRPIILFIVLVLCILQLVISINLGGGNLGIGSIFIPIISGFLTVYFVSIFKSNNETENKNKSPRFKKVIRRIFLYPVIFISAVVLYLYVPTLTDFYNNDLKPRIDGYSLADSEPMKHNEEVISNDLIMFIHYFNEIKTEVDDFIPYIEIENLNKNYFTCIKNDKIFDIGCMKNIQEPFMIDDRCNWTFLGYSPITQYNNHYLVNIEQRACGSFTGRFNSYYLFDYEGDNLIIKKSITPGKFMSRPIKYFKQDNEVFKFITTRCHQGADSCNGQRAKRFEFDLN